MIEWKGSCQGGDVSQRVGTSDGSIWTGLWRHCLERSWGAGGLTEKGMRAGRFYKQARE